MQGVCGATMLMQQSLSFNLIQRPAFTNVVNNKPVRAKSNQIFMTRASAASWTDREYVNYDSNRSVFPAEACDEIGGEACSIEAFGPEVKLNTQAARSDHQPQLVFLRNLNVNADRDYLDYTHNNKTVFPGEACDELGGEFCEAEYQTGVFPERVFT